MLLLFSTIHLCFRWCTSSVREVSTHWCRPVLGRRGWISERWTSLFASMHRRIPSAWCSEWDVLDVSVRDELWSSWLRDARRGWVFELHLKKEGEKSHGPSNDALPNAHFFTQQLHTDAENHLYQSLFPSDLQPEPEQQAQCAQVHYRQQKRVPHVPQQSPNAAGGGKPRLA